MRMAGATGGTVGQLTDCAPLSAASGIGDRDPEGRVVRPNWCPRTALRVGDLGHASIWRYAAKSREHALRHVASKMGGLRRAKLCGRLTRRALLCAIHSLG